MDYWEERYIRLILKFRKTFIKEIQSPLIGINDMLPLKKLFFNIFSQLIKNGNSRKIIKIIQIMC